MVRGAPAGGASAGVAGAAEASQSSRATWPLGEVTLSGMDSCAAALRVPIYINAAQIDTGQILAVRQTIAARTRDMAPPSKPVFNYSFFCISGPRQYTPARSGNCGNSE